MPEGDAVYRTAKTLRAALDGRALTRSDFRVPRYATADLRGRRVLSTESRGKHLLTRVEGGLTVHTHLRMDGSWQIHPTGRPVRGGDVIRLILANTEWQAVGVRLGMVDLLPTAREDQVLLDQRNLAGIGTIWRAETLFLARLSPWREVGAVGSVADLVELAHRLMESSKEGPGPVTTGDPRPGRAMFVYGRARRPCRVCGNPVSIDILPGVNARDSPTSPWGPYCFCHAA